MNPLVRYRKQKENKPPKDKRPQTKHPWLLETVQNGLKATNIKDLISEIKANKKVPIQYFEYDRIFGTGVFESPLKVTALFDELRTITPRTKGYIFNGHKYLYHGAGILRISHEDGEESYFSDDTLRNASLACYLSLVYTDEEDKINLMISELENATDGCQEDRDRRRISDQNPE